jgi:glucosamine kinase
LECESSGYLVGIDGGGTQTRVAVADHTGRELLRRLGPAGRVDSRDPVGTAGVLAGMVREALAEAGATQPAAALCAGLAGVDNSSEREAVLSLLHRAGVAHRVLVCSDGEIALQGAIGSGPGLLLVAGTGSVAFGRSERGRVERCGGWGMLVGDEGSGYAIGRASLAAALRAADGRGAPTELLPVLLAALDVSLPERIPSWAARAEKSEIAALAVHALRLAESGDFVARQIVARAAHDLAEHAAVLGRRLGPWDGLIPVVLHGGLTRNSLYSGHILEALQSCSLPLAVRPAAADAVSGALAFAREALEPPSRGAVLPAAG